MKMALIMKLWMVLFLFYHQHVVQSFRRCTTGVTGVGYMTSRSTRGHRSSYSMTLTKGDDYIISFTAFERILFDRFSVSVATEIGSSDIPRNYTALIRLISYMVFSRPLHRVHEQGTNMLKRLFPGWLLVMYKAIFSKLPTLSARMNTIVTHWTTRWLMGESKIDDARGLDGILYPGQALLVEKCRFLETSGCLRTCLHSCKIPTQNFFYDHMGLAVTLTPNITDLSCRFDFGVMPIPLEKDPISKLPCLSTCSVGSSTLPCTVL